MRKEPMPASLAGDRMRTKERRGRSIQTRRTSVRCQRGVVMRISYSPWTVWPHSRRSTRSMISRPPGSCARTGELPHSRAVAMPASTRYHSEKTGFLSMLNSAVWILLFGRALAAFIEHDFDRTPQDHGWTNQQQRGQQRPPQSEAEHHQHHSREYEGEDRTQPEPAIGETCLEKAVHGAAL